MSHEPLPADLLAEARQWIAETGQDITPTEYIAQALHRQMQEDYRAAKQREARRIEAIRASSPEGFAAGERRAEELIAKYAGRATA
ncbi:hypothetical protein HS041_36725 [Planomonospora sp. ID67723]|uniref:hypothetical protein n=1 Tax=Planomonospora sp. ID67723 TaxID=2738134 RepID=UPI0018C3AFAD|nr:hypothetical protein [Planomonospora sp. ID67723]MBG0833249.1 hypothetical protein [Planomonospora sp. ID67723]